MHRQKNTIFSATKGVLFFLFVGLLAVLSACAGHTAAKTSDAVTFEQTSEEKMQKLEQTFATLLQKMNENIPPESLLVFLTDTSYYWTDTLQRYAKELPAERVEELPLGEMLAVLVYRIFEHERAWDPNLNEDYRMLSLFTGKSGVFVRTTGLKLGPFEIKKDRGVSGWRQVPKFPSSFLNGTIRCGSWI
ncbi:hypothetical protein [Fibrobacter sp. UWS1]|uniref:hypothetical protein n=1 Tax=Fibrobacter sp. UWS1 TaxID=1896220 RepID=UPI000BB0DBDF|nr:hypothetical protein [Fibrobacter sp. UWS1]PBC67989.1 hypothetical protein BGX14_0330 [Fibrobacter sp. UWS1]